MLYKGLLPIMTVSKTFLSSYILWFCSKTDILLPGSKCTFPDVGSCFPANIFKKVDFPEPLAPIIP